MTVNIFIQARMSSTRYPGKVLAPLFNQPIIKHLINQSQQVSGINKIVVLTSTEESDDPLAAYLDKISCEYFRGDLNNVFSRFQHALEKYPCDYFVRLCGDSPLINPNLIGFMVQEVVKSNLDMLSNVKARKFPKGQSVEIIKSKLFAKIDSGTINTFDQEHVMSYFYDHDEHFKISSLDNKIDESHMNMCVDTIEDLKNIELKKLDYFFQVKTVCLKKL